MTLPEQAHGRHAALASDPRRRVLELLRASEAPLDAAAVAAGIRLHVTTARFHLEQLEQAGLVRRLTERAGARGRPRILFVASPATREVEAQRELNRRLAAAFTEDADGGHGRAVRAGVRWSADYAGVLEEASPGGVAPVMRILDRLGFDPEQVAAGGPDAETGTRTIELNACPFREEARQNPDVVCSVHLGLLRGAARALGRDEDDVELHPFVESDLCVVKLRGHWA
jgi:predicted ArsR family transcriptional regulator